MKSFFDLREKTLTPAEKKKREEIATAIERDNPDMPMDKKMAIATATAKKVAEAAMVQAKSADKKPEQYVAPDGKMKIKMVPTKNRKEEPVDEAMGHIGAVQSMIAKERDLEKARDAKKRGVTNDSGWKKPADGQTTNPANRAKKLARSAMKSFKQVREDLKLVGLDEAKVGPSHDEIMKAIGHTKNSAQGIAILQKKFKLSPKEARKHMDMFLKDDVQIDEMGAFMSSPLPTPTSMRKEPSMTRPLMLTKRMNTAATLIKKAGNTPVSPTK
jgi:hypothetical protein